MSWDCSMHPSVISENEEEKFHFYLNSEYRLNPNSQDTSVHFSLLRSSDIALCGRSTLCLHIYKWYTDINQGRLFRNLYLTDSSHSVPPSYLESVKRKERKMILSFHYCVATEYQLKVFNSCQNLSSLKDLTRNKSSSNFGFPVLPVMGALEDLSAEQPNSEYRYEYEIKCRFCPSNDNFNVFEFHRLWISPNQHSWFSEPFLSL